MGKCDLALGRGKKKVTRGKKKQGLENRTSQKVWFYFTIISVCLLTLFCSNLKKKKSTFSSVSFTATSFQPTLLLSVLLCNSSAAYSECKRTIYKRVTEARAGCLQ